MYRLAAGGTFKVRLSKIKNPLSAQVFGPSQVFTFDQGYHGIDESVYFNLPATTTAYIAGTYELSSDFEYTFSFVSGNPYPLGSYIVLTVPSSMTLPSTFTSWSF